MQAGRTATTGVVLSDGTRVDDLIDRTERHLSARVHVDPEIFELELARIFARAWIPVAHTSELREPGDFVTRYVGRDPVIVSLDTEGRHHVMLNACAHRGMQVCRGEVGNTAMHTCPYHGWAYDMEGNLKGAPFEQLIYGDRLDKARLGLRQARVGVLAGIVFATWDAGAPELDEFIGDYRFYLEALLCRTDGGLEVVGPPQRFTVDANWKIVADGFYGDAYHILTLHRSFLDLGAAPPGEFVLYDFKASINGHAVLCSDLEKHGFAGDPLELLTQVPPAGMPPELVGQLERHLSGDQITMLATTPPSIAALFPSTALVMIGGQQVEGPIGQVLSLRFFVPLSPSRTELYSFSLVERDAPPEFKRSVQKSSIGAFGVGGNFESDDVEIWAGVQHAVQGAIGRDLLGNYQAAAEPLAPDPARPGATTYRGVSSDDNQWLFYERYFEFLEDRAW